MGQPRFSKGEKKKCKHYQFGKCLIKAHGKDCQPHTKDGAIPEYIEGCSAFEVRIIGNNLEKMFPKGIEYIERICCYCYNEIVMLPYDTSSATEETKKLFMKYLMSKKVKCAKCKRADKIRR